MAGVLADNVEVTVVVVAVTLRVVTLVFQVTVEVMAVMVINVWVIM